MPLGASFFGSGAVGARLVESRAIVGQDASLLGRHETVPEALLVLLAGLLARRLAVDQADALVGSEAFALDPAHALRTLVLAADALLAPAVGRVQVEAARERGAGPAAGVIREPLAAGDALALLEAGARVVGEGHVQDLGVEALAGNEALDPLAHVHEAGAGDREAEEGEGKSDAGGDSSRFHSSHLGRAFRRGD